MGFNRLAGDQLLEDRDPELAAEIRKVFMSYYVPLAGDLYVSRYQDQPRIVVYIRSDGPVLRIDGPEPHQEWISPPWFGDVGEALTFAGDAGVAAGTDSLPPVGLVE